MFWIVRRVEQCGTERAGVFPAEGKGNLEALSRARFQDQAIVRFLLFQLPVSQSLHDPKRTAGKTLVKCAVQYAGQCHHRSGQSVHRQNDTLHSAIDRNEVEGDLGPPPEVHPSQSVFRLRSGRPALSSPAHRYFHLDIAQCRSGVHPARTFVCAGPRGDVDLDVIRRRANDTSYSLAAGARVDLVMHHPQQRGVVLANHPRHGGDRQDPAHQHCLER